jgi:nucleotide-binding universal stress UspA family protein
MIQNILVGLDGSASSETAVTLAVRWGLRTGATVVGLGVVDEPTIRGVRIASRRASYSQVQWEEKQLDDARLQVRRFLDRFTQRCNEAQVPCRALEEVGQPAERILFLSDDHDLTLLGRQAYYHHASHAEADDTLEIVLHHSRRPIVVVGEQLPESRAVVVAYDSSRPAVRALEAFQRAGLEDWQTVRVVSVAGEEEQARRSAEEAARFLCFHNIPAEARPHVGGRRAADVLLHEVAELGAGMLVMGAFSRSAVKESLYGSTTEAILEAAPSVLFVHR